MGTEIWPNPPSLTHTCIVGQRLLTRVYLPTSIRYDMITMVDMISDKISSSTVMPFA